MKICRESVGFSFGATLWFWQCFCLCKASGIDFGSPLPKNCLSTFTPRGQRHLLIIKRFKANTVRSHLSCQLIFYSTHVVMSCHVVPHISLMSYRTRNGLLALFPKQAISILRKLVLNRVFTSRNRKVCYPFVLITELEFDVP